MTPGKRRVKVGLVGCGVVATAYYLPYLINMDTAELVAVCDVYPERAQACVRLFGAKEAYQDYYQMIDCADIEVVFILTGPGTHADSLKVWQDGTPEPAAWDLVSNGTLSSLPRGSFVLGAHEVAASFGSVHVIPL